MPDLRFCLLGPVRAWQDGSELPLGPPQQRALLAVLLLNDSRPVTLERLSEALWGEQPPGRAVGIVRTYAHRLRRVVGADRLETLTGGYRLVRGAAPLDTTQCDEFAAAAVRHQAEGRLREARAALAQAVGLWQGDALGGLPGPYAERQRLHFTERRLDLIARRATLDLALGRHHAVLAELVTLAAEHPLREQFTELLMLALYRAGRQSDALDAYTAARRRLADEIGVEPGPGLRLLHQQILQADPALTPPADSASDSASGDTARSVPPGQLPRHLTPRQIPFGATDFTGRHDQLHQITTALRDPGVMPVIALSGLGGTGKSELAIQAAHATCADFPDGQLYADLTGHTPQPTPPEEILEGFLHALGLPSQAIPSSTASRTALLRSVLADRRVLLLLDNAKDTEQLLPLLPGSPGSAALVTSRSRLFSLPAMHTFHLEALTPDEALVLFARIVGAERTGAEPDAARLLLEACGHLPLAVRILGSRLVSRPVWSIASLCDRLTDENRRLAALRHGTLTIEATFRLSYDQLTPDLARAFRLLAVPDLTDLPLPVLAAVLDVSPEQAEHLAEALVDASLLETPAPERYRYHDLVRAFARTLTHPDDPAPGQILTRLLTAYGKAADATWVDPGAVAALIRQHTQCTEPGPAHAPAARLLLTTALSHPSSNAALALGRAANQLLPRVIGHDSTAEAEVRLALGRLLVEIGSPTPALAELLHTLRLCAAHALPPALQAHTHTTLGMCFLHVQRYPDAADHFRTAAALHQGLGDRSAAVPELLRLATALARSGRHTEAQHTADTARTISTALAAPALNAMVADTLGTLAHEQGHHRQAIRHYTTALSHHRATNHQRTGRTLLALAQTQRAAHHPDAADTAHRAVTALTHDGDQYRTALALTELGHALHLHDPSRARASWLQAQRILSAIGAPEATTLHRLTGTPLPTPPPAPWPSWTPTPPPNPDVSRP
ncbi:AfsR/SARP family transcriptional regulator [Streptomyces melanogenes]|uniref:AfsR/SARP family transcriptional regulator n=1 Tax=Streptomyces melanogenes TaxID=67326 RepID=UPI00167DFE87|nr:BTAD domain-containing putative transcriptional regulator [Streptomyces melanogenes]GGP91347.1 regulatory protein AfsR [Streptomyces melanogenes]